VRIGWVSLQDFRSYREVHWRPDPSLSILVGPNAAGKTNLLEGVAYLALLRSFRRAPDGVLVHRDAATGIVRGEVRRPDRSALIEIEIPRQGRKQVLLNGKRPARHSELAGALRVVTFLPDDLDLIKRGPGERRSYLDEVAYQVWPGAAAEQAQFERTLRQRNAFLKRGADDPVTWAVWDERLADSGARLVARRHQVVTALSGFLTDAYRDIAGTGRVEFVYRAMWTERPEAGVEDLTADLRRALEASRRTDAERRITTVGPHRDDPSLLVDGRDARYEASQGEQRSLVLALRLAAHRVIREITGEEPVLLLDDVFSELDVDRAVALQAALPPSQTVVTTTALEHVPLEGAIFEVRGGEVMPR
jgi:DNA replication and repair protein RecF